MHGEIQVTYLVASDAVVLPEGAVALHHGPAPLSRDGRIQSPREPDVALHLYRCERGVQRLFRRCLCLRGKGKTSGGVRSRGHTIVKTILTGKLLQLVNDNAWDSQQLSFLSIISYNPESIVEAYFQHTMGHVTAA